VGDTHKFRNEKNPQLAHKTRSEWDAARKAGAVSQGGGCLLALVELVVLASGR